MRRSIENDQRVTINGFARTTSIATPADMKFIKYMSDECALYENECLVSRRFMVGPGRGMDLRT